MDNIEAKLTELEKKIENLTDQVSNGFQLLSDNLQALRGASKGNLHTVETTMKDGFSNVLAELKKLNTVTRYQEEFDNIPKQGEA